MRHQAEEIGQVRCRHALLVQREDEAALRRVDEVVGVLHPLGDALRRDQFADVVAADEGGERLGGHMRVNGHGCVLARQHAWQLEGDVLDGGRDGFDGERVARPQTVDEFLHQHFGGRGAGGDAHGFGAVQPRPVDVRGALHQIGARAAAFGDLAQPERVRRVRRADHEHHVALAGDRLHGVLPVRSGVADVLAARRLNGRKAVAQHVDDRVRVVHRKRRLRQEGEVGGVVEVRRQRIVHGFDQRHRAFGYLPERADHLGMAGVSHEHDVAALLDQPLGLPVHLGDERAGGVHVHHLPRLGGVRHAFGHAVRRKDHRHAFGHLVQLLDEHGALSAQPVDDETVVDDLVAHVDGRPPFLQCDLDDADGAVDASAESARAGHQHAHRALQFGIDIGHDGASSTRLLAASKAASYRGVQPGAPASTPQGAGRIFRAPVSVSRTGPAHARRLWRRQPAEDHAQPLSGGRRRPAHRRGDAVLPRNQPRRERHRCHRRHHQRSRHLRRKRRPAEQPGHLRCHRAARQRQRRARGDATLFRRGAARRRPAAVEADGGRHAALRGRCDSHPRHRLCAQRHQPRRRLAARCGDARDHPRAQARRRRRRHRSARRAGSARCAA